MGGNPSISSYQDATRALRSTRRAEGAFTYSETQSVSTVGKVHDNLNPFGRVRECLDTPAMPNVTPIVFAMDVTRSRGGDAKIVYGEMMPFLGSLFLSGAVTDPQLMFAAIGDAKSDRAPIQIGQFESDERMSNDLRKIWLEEGGGGTGEESYELLAYYLARKTRIDAFEKRRKKGFVFFTGDEAPYKNVSKDEVKRLFGDEILGDITSKKIFGELSARFHPYLIFPKKSAQDRKEDIDGEIRQRLLKAGGRFENCSIRASLIWNTYDDLDLHVVTPRGHHIYFGAKRAPCGGELDVDRNAGGPQTREPVENIRWAKGTATVGKYVVYVQNYSHHERVRKDIPFKVELEVEGVVKTFEGVIPKGVTGPQSNVEAFEFEYTGEQSAKAVASYGNAESYSDEVILGKWRKCIPDGNIVRVNDPKWITQAAIGIMSIQNGKTLSEVLQGMSDRAVPKAGIEEIEQALKNFEAQVVTAQVSEEAFA